MTSAGRIAFANLVAFGALGVFGALGCSGGYAETTAAARTALDQGRPDLALVELNQNLGVETGADVPDDTTGDVALKLLDRSMVLQMLEDYEHSSRDLEISDREIQMLDFSSDTGADIAQYLFTDETGPYTAPAYEKLCINTMNMVNYLARDDLNGARVEARRLAVMQRYISESEGEAAAFLGASSYIAGFVFEMSGDSNEAMRWYDEALARQGYRSLADPVRRLSARTGYRTPRLTQLLSQMPPCEGDACAGPPGAEVLVVVAHGRIPPKVAVRMNVGAALIIAAPFMAAASITAARNLLAQGLVTYVNYPTLGDPVQSWGPARATMDGNPVGLEDALSLDVEAQRAYEAVKGQTLAAAIARMITRVVAGQAARGIAGGGTAGAIASIGTQIAMNAADTPDTRSWGMLPARVTLGRLRVPPGTHTFRIEAGGAIATREITVADGGYGVVILTSLR